MMKFNIKNKIVDELTDLNLPLNGIVFEYWNEILLLEYQNKFKSPNITDKYEYLANKHKSNASAVERALRRGTELMRKQIAKKYKIKTKITNETVLILFKLKVF